MLLMPLLTLAALAFHRLTPVASASLGHETPGLIGPSREYRRDYSHSCSVACASLNTVLPGKVSYPQSAGYQHEELRYWSQQQASTFPTCRVSPTSKVDVSMALQVLESRQCKFAVKSGGHAPFVGASNIKGGVTIDLVNLNQIIVSEDRSQTSVGPGNRWYDVYSKLEPMGLAVIGGRVADIGVGGLTLGGGISFFSGRFGWACDMVLNYEVVFADGTIQDVNQLSYPDLYFALRGGGNNFGIVTRFDLATFPQDGMWGGTTLHNVSDEGAILQAFEKFNINSPSDPNAALFVAFVYVQSEDIVIVVSDYFYGAPVANPPIFHNFTSIPPLESTLRFTNLTDLTLELNASNTGGFQQTFWTFTVKNSATLIMQLVDIFTEELDQIKEVTGVLPSFIIQPITEAMISHFSQRGGNALGITASDAPLILILFSISWSLPQDEALILATAHTLVDRSVALAKSLGLDHRFLYQNYAAQGQNVFASYGEENLRRLRETQRKYDPKGVWIDLQPGYFKVG